MIQGFRDTLSDRSSFYCHTSNVDSCGRCSLLGKRYTSIVQSRVSYSTGSILAHVQGLQSLADSLHQLSKDGSQGVCNDVNEIGVVTRDVESTVSKLVSNFTQYQRDLRTCACSQHDSQALASKLGNRDTARASMCRELRDSLTLLVRCVRNEKRTLSDGRHVVGSALANANCRLQLLRDALDAARDCVVKYNVNQRDVSDTMGALFDASSSGSCDVVRALSWWQEWKASMHYEQVAGATDACMKQAITACSEGLSAMLGVDNQQQEKAEKVKEALKAVGKASDCEAALHASNPMLLVPVTPLMRAAEQLLQATSAQVTALQHVCTVYDDILRLHDTESQCLDLHGEKFALKHRAVEAMNEASKAHKQARARLRRDETLKHLCEDDPSILEEEGTTFSALQEKILEKKRALKEVATVLHTALESLLDVQDYFPEVCVHFKSGLSKELLAVWRPDLTIEMFDSRETLSTGANHTVYKGEMDGKVYALKEFRLASDDGLQKLLREAAMLRKMRHPAIIEIVGVFEDTSSNNKQDRRMLLQMPFFEHGTLDNWVKSEAPEWRTVRTVLLDVAGALEHLHASLVVHCDVKPPNILVAANCRGRLADFDISVDYATRTSTRFAGTKVAYTAGFDAPELPRCPSYLCVC